MSHPRDYVDTLVPSAATPEEVLCLVSEALAHLGYAMFRSREPDGIAFGIKSIADLKAAEDLNKISRRGGG